jgi:nucleoside-diphosphate-sugar epimerase
MGAAMLPDVISTEEELDELLSRPTPGVAEELARLEGDLVILGVGGKMGPTLARMARRALDPKRAVIGVARFSDARAREALEKAGVRAVACDLLDQDAVLRLPDAGAVVFMAGMKFGTSGAASATWATNAVLPGYVAERYPKLPTVVFSSGNVYPLVPVASGGATEDTPPGPVGEYAMSALARERVFEHFSRRDGTAMTIYRLNYAVELRYGTLVDIAQKVWAGTTIDLRMGHLNAIWQGDANAIALRSFGLAASPPALLNVTGPEVLSVRNVAGRFGELLGKKPRLEGNEQPTALLNNAAFCAKRFGPPAISTDTVIRWIARWVKSGGRTLGKPTHFETRDGKF